MEYRPKLNLILAFTAGILITLGFKDFYPDLERRFRTRSNTVFGNWTRSASNAFPSWRKGVELVDESEEEVDGMLDEPGDDVVDSEGIEDAHDEDGYIDLTRLPPVGEGIESTIGNTPMFRIKSLSEATGCEILAKAEFLNGAGGSPKDRVALSMIQSAEAQNLLTPNSGDVIYEGTVGSTGISLASICRARGYTAHICMPSDQSPDKRILLLALGANVDSITPAPIVDTSHFVNRARSLAANHTSSSTQRGRGYFADQFENEANWRAHYTTTGPEIYEQTVRSRLRAREKHARLDAFVAGAGTGGTLSGVALYLREVEKRKGCGLGRDEKPVRVVLADPQGSGLYNKVKHGVMFSPTEREGTRRRQQTDSIVEGIGVTRLTSNFEVGWHEIDDAVRITDQQALRMARWLAQKDGIFIGGSSAVNCVASVRTAFELGPGHTIVTILCDSGARHLSRFWKEAATVDENTNMTLEHVIAD